MAVARVWDRERLRDLSRRLVRLHKTLLDFERATYEDTYGPVRSSGELLDLVLHHEQFLWLRSLSGVMARVDEALDDPDAGEPDVEQLFREIYGLLRSGRGGAFESRYRAVLQASPDVVMAHADVIKLLPVKEWDHA
jgi:hypothetical protein